MRRNASAVALALLLVLAPAAAAAGVPTATNSPATGITESGATIAGVVNPNGSDTSWHFDYGKSATFGSVTPAPDETILADSADHPVSRPLTGLEPNTTYHYRLVATNSFGSKAAIQSVFKTLAIPPGVDAADASDVTATGATLAGAVNPHNSSTTYHFEWGESSAYGQASPDADGGDGNEAHPVTLAVGTLAPSTTYHYRLVASSGGGEAAGEDRTFTTAAAPDPATTDAAPTPKLGTSVVASPAAGTVRVRAPGDGHYTTLGADDVVPVGSLIDTRRGTIEIVTDLGNGHTQTATFWNGVFTVRQSKARGGYTDIYVAPPTGCAKSGHLKKTALRSAGRKGRRNGLWGHDNHGRFRSHGRGSIATVRGTTWLMEERCEGSYTKVKQGKVSVRDKRRHRTVLVRAGHSYLARVRP